jgi:tRNA wybutosine-synthesizing protein 2
MITLSINASEIGFRVALEACGYYDPSRRVAAVSGDYTKCTEEFALPITEVCMETFLQLQDKNIPLPHPFESCLVSRVLLPQSKKPLKPGDRLRTSIIQLLKEKYCEREVSEMAKCIPKSWERHGDMIVLPSGSFLNDLWVSHLGSLSCGQLSGFWALVSSILNCKRLAKGGFISNDGFRSPTVSLLLGDSGWVDHVDNGIHYKFDVTKCMFSSGNITEKLRLANFDCRGETVLDLYAGIGYFVLPYLVHAGADLVHACEWNPHAVEGLKRGLKANGVEGRCIIHVGDNRKVMCQYNYVYIVTVCMFYRLVSEMSQTGLMLASFRVVKKVGPLPVWP